MNSVVLQERIGPGLLGQAWMIHSATVAESFQTGGPCCTLTLCSLLQQHPRILFCGCFSASFVCLSVHQSGVSPLQFFQAFGFEGLWTEGNL